MIYLMDLLSTLDSEMIIHVRNKRIEFSGTVRESYNKLISVKYNEYSVHRISPFLDGLLIEAHPDTDKLERA